MVLEGTFRSDFLYRLRSFIIDLPPLRERSEDIGKIAGCFIAEFCERHRIPVKDFSPEFMRSLFAYKWPGNVRELLHSLERALYVAFHEPTLFPQHLPNHIRIDLVRNAIEGPISQAEPRNGDSVSRANLPSLREFRENTERQYFLELVSLTGGNISEACRISSLSRSRLYDLLKHHNITNQTLAAS